MYTRLTPLERPPPAPQTGTSRGSTESLAQALPPPKSAGDSYCLSFLAPIMEGRSLGQAAAHLLPRTYGAAALPSGPAGRAALQCRFGRSPGPQPRVL